MFLLIHPIAGDIQSLQLFYQCGAVEIEELCCAVFYTAAHFQRFEQKIFFQTTDVIIKIDAVF